MPLPKPKLLAGWRRAKLIALINELYLSFRGCGTCGVVVNALALSTNPQAGPLRYSLAFHLRRSKKPNSEPKLRPPAVSKSLTRSITPGECGASLAGHAKDLGLPVVMISGSNDEISFAAEHGLQLLPKPFQTEALCGALDRALSTGEFGQRIS